MALNLHFTPSHGVAADDTGVGCEIGAAGQAEISFEMSFGFDTRGKQAHAVDNFHEAFLALALLATGRGDLDPEPLRTNKDGVARRRDAGTMIDVQLDAHKSGCKVRAIHQYRKQRKRPMEDAMDCMEEFPFA
jgi:hypothetical protein